MEYISGTPRSQLVLFNTYLDQIIPADHPIRFIDAYVDSLDLYTTGFKIPEMKTGTPPYDPALLLKIYIYCYFEKIRSSRKIEKECLRNRELIWLTGNLRPDFKTIADFRKDNKRGIGNIFRDFLHLCKKLDLLSLRITATDGTKMRAQNGRNEIYNRDTIEEVQERIEERIAEYLNELENNDEKETEELTLDSERTDRLVRKLQQLKKKHAKLQDIRELFEKDEALNTYFATDPDARFQSDKGSVAAGYNVQICADEKHKLVISNDITNESNDLKQMTPMIEALQETKGDLDIHENTKNIMDAGYASEQQIIKNKNKKNIEILVQDKKEVEKSGKRKKALGKRSTGDKVPQEGFSVEDFEYDETADVYFCPQGKKLQRVYKNPVTERSGRKTIVYKCVECEGCKSHDKCTRNKRGRSIAISVNHKEMIEYQETLRSEENQKIMAKRKEIVEHPFGTIKSNWGFTGFLQRGKESVRTEFSFICFIYNLKRVLNIIPLKDLLIAIESK